MNKRTQNSSLSIEELEIADTLDYPVGAYYVDLNQVYNKHISWHWHEEMEFDIIKKGCARITVGDEVVELSAGQGLFINQNVLHTIFPAGETDCTYYSIIFHPSYLFGYGRLLTSTKYLIPILASPVKHMCLSEQDSLQRGILQRLNKITAIHLAHEYGEELLIKSELCLLWLDLIELLQPDQTTPLPDAHITSATPDETRVKQAITYIQDHHMQQISLEDIASSVHISKSECCRCFKRTLSLTPFEYLMKYRIYTAAKKIYSHDSTADSIAALAVSVGFNNTSYFNKLFKKYLHCTPNTYKRMLSQNPDMVWDAFGHPIPPGYR
ncbi:MAG: AraC family transcriptional regulator [Clostridiales bacterium]|nr:AraC family transcriptional regulator [Clostridiales bacterium]